MWVLIIAIHIGYGTGVTSVEFPSQNLCEQAKTEALKHFDGFNTASDAVCIRKQ